MKLILKDHGSRSLYPLALTRPVAALRFGILTIQEKWEHELGLTASHRCADYLSANFPTEVSDDDLIVRGNLLPTDELVSAVKALPLGRGLKDANGEVLATRVSAEQRENKQAWGDEHFSVFAGELNVLNKPWQLFKELGVQIEEDIARLAASVPDLVQLDGGAGSGNTLVGEHPVFMEPGAKVTGAIINTSNGPVYLRRNAEIMEGSVVRGPFALGEGAALKMGAKIYGPTAIGPHCKVGGEVNNCLILGFSNKGHDGFIGNSVIGEWCNLGADTNTSNLKNNYGPVRVWDYESDNAADTGLIFHGLVMGDHAKCGINTMFNTGTVVGVFANVFGGGFPPKFIPSFAWGGADGFTTYQLDKAFGVAEAVMARRSVEMTDADRELLKTVYAKTEKYRAGAGIN